MSAFQLSRGYTPSILGIPHKVVSQNMLEAHIEREAMRAFERIKHSNVSSPVCKEEVSLGMVILVFYKSSKQNDPDECIKATFQRADDHYVLCRRSQKGSPMSVAYEDVRMLPSGELKDELMCYAANDDDFDDQNSASAATYVNSNEKLAEGMSNQLHDGTERSTHAVEEKGEEDCKEAPNEQDMSKADHDDEGRRNATIMSIRSERMDTENENVGNLRKDLGDLNVDTDGFVGDWTSDVQTELKEMHSMIGCEQVTIWKMERSPSWIIRKALREEHN